MKNFFMLFAIFCSCLCNSVQAAIKITDTNFREKAEIVQYPYNFYIPQKTDEWKSCMQYSRVTGLVGDCRLTTFTKMSPLDIAYFTIALESTQPLKYDWLETIAHEILNQEHFMYFTTIQKYLWTMHIAQKGVEPDYKKCDKQNDSEKCLYYNRLTILAYNEPNALRNGVIYDAGVQNGELFVFYPLYLGDKIDKTDVTGALFVEENIKQAWETTNKVDLHKTNPIMRYNIQQKGFDNRPKANFSRMFDICRDSITDKNGRFTQYDECYCTCVQDETNMRVTKATNPDVVAKEIMDTSWRECDVLKQIAVFENDSFKWLKAKVVKPGLDKSEQCVYDAQRKYIENPYDDNPVNMCNIKQIKAETDKNCLK